MKRIRKTLAIKRFLKYKMLWAALLAMGLLSAGCAEKPLVSTVGVDNRRIEVSFTERAETTLRQEYPITMPVNGRIGRIALEIGDAVSQGDTLVSVDVIPARQEMEARQAGVQATQARQQVSFDTTVEHYDLEQAQKRTQSVRAQFAQVGSAIAAAETTLKNARIEERRVETLVAQGALPSREIEGAQQALAQAQAQLAAEKAQSQVLSAQLAEAQAAVSSVRARLERKLGEARAQTGNIEEAQVRREQAQYTLQKSSIVSPIDGLVLTREERGPKELPAGAPLLTLGRLQDLEVECDVLSQDALRISRGTPVFLDAGSAYPESLRGEVRLKEPQGFTKRSSLGVEQQRVNVRVSLLNPPENLGAAYEMWARFLVQQKTAPCLPRSCFVRQGPGYFVWRVNAQSKLEKVIVEVGLKGDELWEVTGPNLKLGDKVVAAPSDELAEDLEVVVDKTT